MAVSRSQGSLNYVTEGWPCSKDDYDLEELINRGSTSTVFRSFCNKRQEICAVKRIDLDKSNLYELGQEMKTMWLCRHPNILRFYTSFYVERELWVVMQLLDRGNLRQILDRQILVMGSRRGIYRGVLNENVIASLLLEVLAGLDYIHRNAQIHRDVKAANILVSSDGEVRLADFGSSVWVPGEGKADDALIGTPCYMAPEIADLRRANSEGYNCKIDVWSLGITTLEMAAGYPPYDTESVGTILRQIRESDPPSLDLYKGKYDAYGKKFRHFVASCLKKEPEKRWATSKLLQHPFVIGCSRGRGFLKRTLEDIPFALLAAEENLQRFARNLPGPPTEMIKDWDYPTYPNEEEYEIDSAAPYQPPKLRPHAKVSMLMHLVRMHRGRRSVEVVLPAAELEYHCKYSLEEQVFKLVERQELEGKYATAVLAHLTNVALQAQKKDITGKHFDFEIEKDEFSKLRLDVCVSQREVLSEPKSSD